MTTPPNAPRPPQPRTGALAGLKVIEFAGLGPAPFAAMLLADHGAQVLRIDRKGAAGGNAALFAPDKDILQRHRAGAVALDLKQPAGVAAALELVAGADVLIEGFRPGVMERLGLGPEVCLTRRPALVYGRMTGWGQTGPWARLPGHDLTYVALSGALHAIGTAEGGPVAPLNLVADMGGGGMMLAFGVLAAVLAARGSGRGQVVDAAMVDGCGLLLSMIHAWQAMGTWQDARGANDLDGAAPWYRVYACADGRHLVVAPIEAPFWRAFLERAGLADDPLLQDQHDRVRWPAQRARIAQVLATRPRDAWMAVFEGSDACVAPVLALAEAGRHPHMAARGTHVTVGNVTQAAPAPRLAGTPAAPVQAIVAQFDGAACARAWGADPARVAAWQAAGVLG